MRRKMFWIAPAAMIAIPLFSFIGGEIVQHLWNWLLPPLFGWHALTFWQALGILVLCRILFGHWGHRGFQRSNFRRRMRERWASMTPEQQEHFRQALRERGRCAPYASETKTP